MENVKFREASTGPSLQGKEIVVEVVFALPEGRAWVLFRFIPIGLYRLSCIEGAGDAALRGRIMVRFICGFF